MVEIRSIKGRVMGPLAGKPDELAGEVTRMKNVAVTIEKLVALLGDVESGKKSKSQKVDKLKETAGKAKTALAKAKEIYRNTGSALDTYQSQLDTSVTNAKKAYNSAVDLSPRLDTAREAYNGAVSAKHKADTRTTSSPADETARKNEVEAAQSTVTSTHKTYTDLQTEMDRHRRAWDTAKDDLDDAAGVARGKIQDAIDNSPAKDSWWDNLAGFLKILSNILGWVALAVAIAAIFLTGPLGLLAVAVATALTVGSLVVDASLAIGGKGSWTAVGLDALGLLPFGKLLGKGGKLSAKIGKTLKGPLENLKDLKYVSPKRAAELKAAMKKAVHDNPLSRSGHVMPKRAAVTESAVNGAPSPANVWASLKAGGTHASARMNYILDHLWTGTKGADVPIRDARALLATGAPNTADGIVTGGQLVLGGARKFTTDFTDWNMSEIFGDSSPSVSLKDRVMSSYMDGMPQPAATR